jgi:hypothetical protein
MENLPPLFIAGHRKTATTMLLNLFDGHSELAVYPTDVNLFYGYFPIFTGDEYSEEERLKRIHKVVFDDLHSFDIFNNEDEIEKFRSSFSKKIHGRNLGDMREVVECMTSAFREVTGQEGDSVKYQVLKETSLEIYASEIFNWFPDAKYIHIVRDPRDNYAAIKAGVKRYGTFGDDEKTLLNSILNRGKLGMELASINQEVYGEERYKVVRFEDIVSSPEATLRDICSWLNIEYTEKMITPTVLGRPTKGNNYNGLEFYDISAKNVGRWRDRITEEEASIIEFHFSDEMDAFNYEKSFSKSETLKPVADFYKWLNYKYFYFDRFENK